MPWNNNSPDGAKSVKQNTVPMQQNTSYILDTMQKDHFWNEGGDESGHHKWAQMVATNDADKSLQTNMALATGMDASFFTRFMTPEETNEVDAASNTQAFFVSQNATAPNESILQLLGIRACCVFNVTANGATITQLYSFNIKTQVGITEGIVRTDPGEFRANFVNNLPSENYFVLGGCVNTTANARFIFNMRPSSSISAAKDVTRIRFHNQDMQNASTSLDPLQCWFICFGG